MMTGKEDFRAWLAARYRQACSAQDGAYLYFDAASRAARDKEVQVIAEITEEFDRLMPFWESGNVKTVIDD